VENCLNISGMKIGNNQPTWICAEIGINHNASLDIAKKLIDVAKSSGCDAIKFQKRTTELQYTNEELAQPRISPFGATNGDLKRALEFGYDDYCEIDKYCKKIGIIWLASAWDKPSVDFLEQFNVPAHKIPSAKNNDYEFIKYVRKTNKPIIMSCGMSTSPEICDATSFLNLDNIALLVCTATYPASIESLNLNRIHTLQNGYPGIPIGYSHHNPGLWMALCAVAMGSCLLEFHVTLDRSLFGSDQSSSIEPQGIKKLIQEIRCFEQAKGNGVLEIHPSEIPVMEKLHRLK